MPLELTAHHYIDRESGRVCAERPFGDWIVNYFYNAERDDASLVYRLLGSPWVSQLLAWVNYDFPLGKNISGIRRFLNRCQIDLSECLGSPESFDSARKLFERKIRYWQFRPMPEDDSAVVCPADARLLIGSLKDTSYLHLKGKFFDLDDLLGGANTHWRKAFRGGDFVICRLTPEKYHYNHTPVSGTVRDIYEYDGSYHSCNPGPVITLATPYSKNKRVVTIIDTDVKGGTRVGLVAMIEVVALMIGEIVQCYSRVEYQNPQSIRIGYSVDRGCPKSLFRPGSSTTVLLFQENRVSFSQDLLRNLQRADVLSRYAQGLGRPLVETDVKVRSMLGKRKTKGGCHDF
jgi:phosphatidylserine decarboxylase